MLSIMHRGLHTHTHLQTMAGSLPMALIMHRGLHTHTHLQTMAGSLPMALNLAVDLRSSSLMDDGTTNSLG